MLEWVVCDFNAQDCNTYREGCFILGGFCFTLLKPNEEEVLLSKQAARTNAGSFSRWE